MKIFVIGHISPDLDTVAAAYVYSKYLTQLNAYPHAQIEPLITEEPNLETKVIFEKFGVKLPKLITQVQIAEEDRFILVDHNEEAQRHPLVKNEHVIEIVDHHKINITFTSPIKIDVRPLASTCTAIHLLYKAHNLPLEKTIELLILAAILSDTVGLRSATTTQTDTAIANEIVELYGIDLDMLIFELFKAKSDITGLSVEELIKKDYKVFDFAGKKVFIGSIETVEPEKVLDLTKEIVLGLNTLKVEQGIDLAFLCVTDILRIDTQVVYETKEEGRVLEKAFSTVASSNVAVIGPKISRKKEIAPAIEVALS